jgi:hypothetical protein
VGKTGYPFGEQGRIRALNNLRPEKGVKAFENDGKDQFYKPEAPRQVVPCHRCARAFIEPARK